MMDLNNKEDLGLALIERKMCHEALRMDLKNKEYAQIGRKR